MSDLGHPPSIFLSFIIQKRKVKKESFDNYYNNLLYKQLQENQVKMTGENRGFIFSLLLSLSKLP